MYGMTLYFLWNGGSTLLQPGPVSPVLWDFPLVSTMRCRAPAHDNCPLPVGPHLVFCHHLRFQSCWQDTHIFDVINSVVNLFNTEAIAKSLICLIILTLS
jgi:hypothetical protein